MFKTIFMAIIMVLALVLSIGIYWVTISYTEPDTAESIRSIIEKLDWKYVEPEEVVEEFVAVDI